MGAGFKKFKRKVLWNTIIRAVSYALSCGAVAVALTVAVLKLIGVEQNFIYHIISGAVATAVGGTISFGLLLRSNTRIAKSVDEELGLGEKAQTMLEFDGADGVIIELQRQDADARLKELSSRKFLTRKIWTGAVTLIISVGLIVGATFIPTKESEEPYDPDYSLSDWQRVSLENLIQYVRESDAETEMKEYTVDALEGLLGDLENAKKESLKNELVGAVITRVRVTVDRLCAYDDIGENMKNNGDECMEKFDVALNELMILPDSPTLDTMRGEFNACADSAEFSSMVDDFANGLTSAIHGFDGNTNILLYGLLANIQKQTASLAEKSSNAGYPLANAKSDLDQIFDLTQNDLYDAMSTEYNNMTVGDYVVTELMRIFNVADPDGGSSSDGNGNGGAFDGEGNEVGTEAPDNDKVGDDGGMGSGDTLYGSKDSVFDYKNNTMTAYGNVIGDYQAKQEEAMENAPDGLKDAMQDYFESVYTPSGSGN